MINIIKFRTESILFDCYLISTSSIPNLKNLLEKTGILEDEENKDFFDFFREYDIEKNIIVFSDYNECNEIAKKNDEKENEFIILDKKLIDNLKIQANNKSVKLDKNKSIIQIKFSSSQKEIKIQEKKFFFYKFIPNEDSVAKNELIHKQKLKLLIMM